MFAGDDFDPAALGGHDEGDEQLGAFAREALIHQPLSYAKVVARDFVRYFEPSFQPQDFSGYGYDELDVELRLPAEPIVVSAINSYYGDVAIEVEDGIEPLGELQDVVRIHPKLLALAILLAVAGLILGRGRARAGVALLLGTSLVLLLVAAGDRDLELALCGAGERPAGSERRHRYMACARGDQRPASRSTTPVDSLTRVAARRFSEVGRRLCRSPAARSSS